MKSCAEECRKCEKACEAMDSYADDLSELKETLRLTGCTLVGHSAGGGEVARYIGRHGTKRLEFPELLRILRLLRDIVFSIP